MEIGNVVGGLGAGASAVIQHRVKASWFLYKELALAFSIHILFGRLGSATSYLMIGTLVEKIGLQPCLWIGAVFVAVASVACLVMAFFNERGATMVNTAPPAIDTHIIRSFLKSLDGVFWCFTLMVLLAYGSVATFTANGPNFIAVSCQNRALTARPSLTHTTANAVKRGSPFKMLAPDPSSLKKQKIIKWLMLLTGNIVQAKTEKIQWEKMQLKAKKWLKAPSNGRLFRQNSWQALLSLLKCWDETTVACFSMPTRTGVVRN